MKVLAVGAHYDDIELGCSGTLVKHVQAGDQVTLLVITNSAYRRPDGTVVRDERTALNEGKESAALIGADLKFLDYETFYVPFDDMLGIQILKCIEDLQIDTIYSHWVHDLHRDHQYAGRTTLMAGRHVPRFLMYRSNFYDTDQIFRAHFYSDISSVIDKKIDVIKAHSSEMKRVHGEWLTFFLKQHENDGQKIGVKYAECFEVVRYLI